MVCHPVVSQVHLLKKISHQRPDQVCLLRQPDKTRLQQEAVTALQFGQAGIAQPVGHAAQGIE
jgi:hypothetical protein